MITRRYIIAFFALNLLVSTFFLDVSVSANPMSRALPVLALFEQGTFRIDAYKDLTIDKSLIDGHYYSDKAPLTSLIVLPFYAVLRLLRVDFTPTGELKTFPIIIIGDVLCGSVPFVIAMTLSLTDWLRRESLEYRSVLVVILSWYGSFLFVWSGVYFGHLLAGLFLLLSYIQLIDRKNFLTSGVFLGLAILTDYPSALALPIWLGYILWTEEKRVLSTGKLVWGLVPAGLFLLLFNDVVFGRPFVIGYGNVALQAFSAMRNNFGFGWPNIEALYGVLFSRFRGLLFFSPVLVWLCFQFLVERTGKKNLGAAMSHPLFVLTLAYILMNSSYYMWWGGGSYGPRHLIPIAMLLIFEAVRHYDAHSKLLPGLLIFGILGILMGFLAKATCGAVASERFKDPLFQLILPSFTMGEFSEGNLAYLFFGVAKDLAIWCWPAIFLASSYLLVRLVPRKKGHVKRESIDADRLRKLCNCEEQMYGNSRR